MDVNIEENTVHLSISPYLEHNWLFENNYFVFDNKWRIGINNHHYLETSLWYFHNDIWNLVKCETLYYKYDYVVYHNHYSDIIIHLNNIAERLHNSEKYYLASQDAINYLSNFN